MSERGGEEERKQGINGGETERKRERGGGGAEGGQTDREKTGR